MPHEKLKRARKKLERRRRKKKAKQRARSRRIRRGEPEGVREKAAVTKREASKLKDEVSKTFSMGAEKPKKAAKTGDSVIDKVFGTADGDSESLFGRDSTDGDSPLFQDTGTSDEPLLGGPGSGGDTSDVDLGFGMGSMDGGADDIDPMFGPSDGSRDDQDFVSDDDSLFKL